MDDDMVTVPVTRDLVLFMIARYPNEEPYVTHVALTNNQYRQYREYERTKKCGSASRSTKVKRARGFGGTGGTSAPTAVR